MSDPQHKSPAQHKAAAGASAATHAPRNPQQLFLQFQTPCCKRADAAKQQLSHQSRANTHTQTNIRVPCCSRILSLPHHAVRDAHSHKEEDCVGAGHIHRQAGATSRGVHHIVHQHLWDTVGRRGGLSGRARVERDRETVVIAAANSSRSSKQQGEEVTVEC